MISFVSKWWPTMVVAAVILYGTLSSDPAGVEHLPMFPGADKLIHAVMFGGLAGALAFDWQRAHRGEIVSKKLMAAFCAACIVAGGLDEIAQGAMENGPRSRCVRLRGRYSGCGGGLFRGSACRAARYRGR